MIRRATPPASSGQWIVVDFRGAGKDYDYALAHAGNYAIIPVGDDTARAIEEAGIATFDVTADPNAGGYETVNIDTQGNVTGNGTRGTLILMPDERDAARRAAAGEDPVRF